MRDTSHRFAAILAADVAHFSQHMEADSEATVSALKDCRAIFRSCISFHGGREFGSVGDSLMAEFPSAVEALRAARECQQAFKELDLVGNSGERLALRVGIDAGDMIDDGKAMFGQAVNTAARLQQLARPGGIVLSAFVHHQVSREPGISFRSLGRYQLRNIGEPVAIYEVDETHHAISLRRIHLITLRYLPAIAASAGVVIAGLMFVAYFEIRERPGIAGSIEVLQPALDHGGIGVLPLVNLSSDDKDTALLTKAIYDDLLTGLAKIEGLRVVSRKTMSSYGESDDSMSEIASDLGVAHILEGSVVRIGSRAKVNVQLIHLPDDTHLWAETYQLNLTAVELFAMEAEIVGQMVTALQAALAGKGGFIQCGKAQSDRLSGS